jgi:integrase
MARYTVSQVKAILGSLQDPADLVLVAVAAFAGLRPSEISCLDWHDIRDKHIVVRGQKANSRLVTISLTLLAWLAPFQCVGGVNLPSPEAVARRARAAGIKVSFSTLRKTYITYACALTGDVLAVAQQAGIVAPTLASHHVMPATREEAEKFWALAPDACGHADWAQHVKEYLAALAKPNSSSSNTKLTTPPSN